MICGTMIVRGVLAIALLAVVAGAQVPADVLARLEQLGYLQVDGEAATPAAPTPGDDAETGAEPSERQKKLAALQFDRRPSAILRAWSTPPEPAGDAADADATDAGATGADATDSGATGAGATVAGATVATAADATDADATDATASAAPASATDALPAAPTADPDFIGPLPPPTAEELAAQAAQAAAQEKVQAEAEAARVKAQAEALARELEAFQRMVTLGAWDEVDAYLASLPATEGEAGYRQLLVSLDAGPPKPQHPFAKYAETNHFAPGDVVGLMAAAPMTLGDDELVQLAHLLQQAVAGGALVEHCVARLREACAGDPPRLEPLACARVLVEAGYAIEAGGFLPEPDAARADDDRVALNLLARHYLAREADDDDDEDDREQLVRAWEATQAVLADGELDETQKEEALARAVALAPRLSEELGQAWLDESFTTRPARGMEILAVIGSAVAGGRMDQAKEQETRLGTLRLQSTAVDALLRAAPELAASWRDSLTLLAANWLAEARYSHEKDTSTSRGPAMQRDVYGNYFWYSSRAQAQADEPAAIASGELLDVRPSEGWLAFVDEGLRPHVEIAVAQLLLKVGDEEEAFPTIERLAGSHPERARDLAHEFLDVWIEDHDPNAAQRRTNSYVWFYGFEERANAIPLTRSKQERNLAELGEWVARLRALPIERLDETRLTRAFTAAHSTAEVYRLETIEGVFGGLDALDPQTLASLVQTMRANLVSVWRDPAVQEEKKTRRRQRDIQAEVLRGYEVAGSVLERGLAGHPGEWSLALARAALMHDENTYRHEVEPSAEFAARRAAAFDAFAEAAALYGRDAETRREDDESAEPYLVWLYASLGASDLAAIDRDSLFAEAQVPAIRAALDALPGEARERHRAMFANTLFTRMSSVDPAVKFRYVRAGLDVAGDHERAREARDVLEYYEDLVTEIRLETHLDGADRVGTEPFGVFVDIVHTREIEREAGGFAKYLVNQNAQAFSWNYGRPAEDYRDKFEEAARAALDERFEVRSVTFNHPETHSRALPRYGWRVTPYAYLLLVARGPEVDQVPPLRLDLDFLDTSGYAVLPVESSPIVLDASGSAAPRPFEDLEITQTLDERQAGDGRLLLEITARAHGLVPALETCLEIGSEGFEVTGVEDQGASVAMFDEESEGTQVFTDRTWVVALRARDDLERLPETFAFGRPRDERVASVYQRYADADLQPAEAVIALEASYGDTRVDPRVLWTLGIGVLAIAGIVALVRARARRARAPRIGRYRVPETLSPFTVIGLLHDIERNNGVTDAERRQLRTHIDALEGYYFDRAQGDSGRAQADPPDLRAIAESWVARVS